MPLVSQYLKLNKSFKSNFECCIFLSHCMCHNVVIFFYFLIILLSSFVILALGLVKKFFEIRTVDC